MKHEAEIMTRLENAYEEISPLHQSKVYIIMWKSSRSGGTYTALRKSIKGKDRFLEGLEFFGVDLSEVFVNEIEKQWVPVKKDKKEKKDDKLKLVPSTHQRKRRINRLH